MTNLEMRAFRLEQLATAAQKAIADLQAAVAQLAQAQTQGNPYNFGGGGGAGSYCCLPTSLAGATGSWPSLTPGSQTLDVYVAQAGTLALFKSSATVYNFYPAAAVASKVAQCALNGDGTFSITAQSCT